MIYIIENSDKFYKIGYTNNIERRLKQLKTANSGDLKVLKTIETKYDSKVEAYLKYIFKWQRISGEWFDLSDEDICNIEQKIRVHENALYSISNNNF